MATATSPPVSPPPAVDANSGESRRASGLSSADAQRRLVEFGPNELRREQSTSRLTLLAHRFAADMKGHLFVLLACLFVVMIGFGITLPVLPFYVERLALAQGASRQLVVLHVGLLTGIYAVMQLVFAPLWGRWSDRIGRRPLLLVGIAGYVVAQVLFGLASSLWLLYAARIVGGMLSAATLPVSAAYVADLTSDEERGRGMAWLGTATSLGVVVGPALGGVLSRRDWHLNVRLWHFTVDSFSIPFFAAALLGVLTLCAALRWLPESMPSGAAGGANTAVKADWRTMAWRLSPLLALALAGQFALTMFEATFALYAQAMFNYGSCLACWHCCRSSRRISIRSMRSSRSGAFLPPF